MPESALQQEATETRRPCAATGKQAPLAATREILYNSNKDPEQPKRKLIKLKSLKEYG